MNIGLLVTGGYVMGAMRLKGKSYLSSLHLLKRSHSFALEVSWHTALTPRCQFSMFKNKRPGPHVFIELSSNNESDCPYEMSKEQEDLLTKGNFEAKLKLQETLLLLYLKKSRGEILPEALSVEEFIDLMYLSPHDANHWLSICSSRRLREKKIAAGKVLEAENKAKINKLKVERTAAQDQPYLEYKCSQNCLSLPVLKRSLSHFYNTIMSKGLIFGQELVFDCSYDAYMTEFGFRTTASDIYHCIQLNRKNLRPFSFHFCNVSSNSQVMHFLKRRNPKFEFDLPVGIHSSSYLDLFERERIVYLSPHVNKELEYHPDDVYVLGGISKHKEPLSLKKAQFEGIRCARFPVGYQQWAFEILLSKKNTGNWIHIRKLDKNSQVL